jgi:AcrR family transcriptional regulator
MTGNKDLQPLSKDDATKGERTRSDIIQAAHDLIIQNGYHGTSMRQIAKKAGIALGGIYNHFASKEDIFREVVLAYHPYHEIIPVLANARYDSIEELLRGAVHLVDDTLNTRPEVLNLMFIEIVEFRSRHIPELIERFYPTVGQILQRFMQAEDTLRPIPLPMLMRTFMGMLLGYIMTKSFLGEQIPAEFRENALEHFLDVYLHGVLKTEKNS